MRYSTLFSALIIMLGRMKYVLYSPWISWWAWGKARALNQKRRPRIQRVLGVATEGRATRIFRDIGKSKWNELSFGSGLRFISSKRCWIILVGQSILVEDVFKLKWSPSLALNWSPSSALNGQGQKAQGWSNLKDKKIQ